MTRGSQEPNPVFPPEAMIQYLLIQYFPWLQNLTTMNNKIDYIHQKYTSRSTLVAQSVKCLPSAQVIVPESWDTAPHWVLCSERSLLLPLPAAYPACVLSNKIFNIYMLQKYRWIQTLSDNKRWKQKLKEIITNRSELSKCSTKFFRLKENDTR